MRRHGGELGAMARTWGIPRGEWLDLSTGINPHGWPVPVGALSEAVWRRLPEADDGLLEAAADYYGVPADCLAALPGSQAGIGLLPGLFPAAGRVAVPEPTYNEHAAAWRDAGYAVMPVAPDVEAVDAAVRDGGCRYAVAVNPNNPTGDGYPVPLIREWADILHARGGCLIVDEAFADCDPAGSCLNGEPPPGLVVLRSVGKFFGLAGIRLGFTAGRAATIEPLRERLGPWAVNHPARVVGQSALADRDWQKAMRARLADERRRLQALLGETVALQSSSAVLGGCALFQSLYWPERAQALFEHCARNGVYVRWFADYGWVRFGLPADEAGWRRLEKVLSTFE